MSEKWGWLRRAASVPAVWILAGLLVWAVLIGLGWLLLEAGI